MTTPYKQIIEAALLSVGEPLTAERLCQLFEKNDEAPEAAFIKEQLTELMEDYKDRGIELVKVASGYRFQAKQDYAEWVGRLWDKKAPRYSRALLETLALIIYRQPITRGEIEEVRGVAVSTHIIKTLQDREWVKVVGQRDVPGKPALFGTTKKLLDYFNLKNLSEFPKLQDVVDLDKMEEKLTEQLALEVDSEKAIESARSEVTEEALQESEAAEAILQTEDNVAIEEVGEEIASVADALSQNEEEVIHE